MFRRREQPRRFGWSSFRPVGRNPFLPLSRHFSRAPIIDQPPSETVEVYSDHPSGLPQYATTTALAILNEPLVHCSSQAGGRASANSGALATYAGRINKLARPWNTFIFSAFHHAYYKALQHVPNIRPTPQQERHLVSEGDVADLIMSNVLSSIPAILTSLLSEDVRHVLEVAIQHHPTIKLPQPAQDDANSEQEAGTADTEKKKPDSTYVYPDHVLFLSRRRNPPIQHESPHLYLIIVEEKRAGYVVPHDWRAGKKASWLRTDNPQAHLDQMVGYGALTGCEHFLLTDYYNGVALTSKMLAEGERLAAHVAAYPHGVARNPQQLQKVSNPVDGGLRHAVCMLSMKALYDLGVLDPKKAPGLPAVPLAASVKAMLQEHRGEEEERVRTPLEAEGHRHGTRKQVARTHARH